MNNQHLIKEAFACYSIIEPGDGTRYTAFYVPMPDDDPDNMYVALGPASHLVGGYLIRRSSLKKLAARIYKAAKEEGVSLSSLLMNDHYVGYWSPHFKAMAKYIGNDWTTIAAVLYGLVQALSPVDEDSDLSLKFIGDVYKNRTVAVVTTLAMWGIGPDSEQ